MLDHQRLSFFTSTPLSLITHPRRPAFMDTLFPRFHAYLWSDWYGGYHHWGKDTKRFATTRERFGNRARARDASELAREARVGLVSVAAGELSAEEALFGEDAHLGNVYLVVDPDSRSQI